MSRIRRRPRSGRQEVVEGFDTRVDGRDCYLEFTRVTTWDYDPNADCDADGNRGHAVTSIDEDYVEGVKVAFEDEDGKPIMVFPETTQAAIAVVLDKYLQEVESTPEDPYGDQDDDYDEKDDR